MQILLKYLFSLLIFFISLVHYHVNAVNASSLFYSWFNQYFVEFKVLLGLLGPEIEGATNRLGFISPKTRRHIPESLHP